MTVSVASKPLTVLQLHNIYRWGGTGENDAVEATCRLLKAHGISVHEVTRDSRTVSDGLASRVRLAAQGLWSRAAHAEVSERIRDVKPDVAHIHNVYPMLSPSVIAACREAGVPVVMTCHNYRLICPTGGVFRDGKICTKCAGAGGESWCVVHNCRGNVSESAAYALRSAAARVRGDFTQGVSRFMAPSGFTARVLQDAGVPAERIDVVPCMIPTHPHRATSEMAGEYVAFAGRLSEEKGLDLLLEAASTMPDVPIRIAGDGPLKAALMTRAPRNVAFEGYLPAPALARFYRAARLAVVPSLWYETFGIVPAEALSHGVPVVASRFGALEELVPDEECGLLFERGNAADLAAKIQTLWTQPELCARLGARGREHIINRCSPESHLRGLLSTYSRAVERPAVGDRRRNA